MTSTPTNPFSPEPSSSIAVGKTPNLNDSGTPFTIGTWTGSTIPIFNDTWFDDRDPHPRTPEAAPAPTSPPIKRHVIALDDTPSPKRRRVRPLLTHGDGTRENPFSLYPRAEGSTLVESGDGSKDHPYHITRTFEVTTEVDWSDPILCTHADEHVDDRRMDRDIRVMYTSGHAAGLRAIAQAMDCPDWISEDDTVTLGSQDTDSDDGDSSSDYTPATVLVAGTESDTESDDDEESDDETRSEQEHRLRIVMPNGLAFTTQCFQTYPDLNDPSI